jgi:hypothetical protein
MPLYHAEIGFPSRMKFRPVSGLIPSNHATFAARNDRYGIIPMPTDFDPAIWQVVEIEVVNGALHKIVARKPLDEKNDVVMAFIVQSKVIKTVWINVRDDSHKTLDRSVYSVP